MVSGLEQIPGAAAITRPRTGPTVGSGAAAGAPDGMAAALGSPVEAEVAVPATAAALPGEGPYPSASASPERSSP